LSRLIKPPAGVLEVKDTNPPVYKETGDEVMEAVWAHV
jgi:hypothetical protein